MRQITFACKPSFEEYARVSRREQFLNTMEAVVPWSELEALIEPHYPKAGRPLVHYGIRGLIHNTPYSGRNARLEDAVKEAHEQLVSNHGEFDSVYLYMDFNGGKLVQLFPGLITLLDFSHQPG